MPFCMTREVLFFPCVKDMKQVVKTRRNSLKRGTVGALWWGLGQYGDPGRIQERSKSEGEGGGEEEGLESEGVIDVCFLGFRGRLWFYFIFAAGWQRVDLTSCIDGPSMYHFCLVDSLSNLQKRQERFPKSVWKGRETHDVLRRASACCTQKKKCYSFMRNDDHSKSLVERWWPLKKSTLFSSRLSFYWHSKNSYACCPCARPCDRECLKSTHGVTGQVWNVTWELFSDICNNNMHWRWVHHTWHVCGSDVPAWQVLARTMACKSNWETSSTKKWAHRVLNI